MNAREALKWMKSSPMVGISACTGCRTNYHKRWHKTLRMFVGVGCHECNYKGWSADEYPTPEQLNL